MRGVPWPALLLALSVRSEDTAEARAPSQREQAASTAPEHVQHTAESGKTSVAPSELSVTGASSERQFRRADTSSEPELADTRSAELGAAPAAAQPAAPPPASAPDADRAPGEGSPADTRSRLRDLIDRYQVALGTDPATNVSMSSASLPANQSAGGAAPGGHSVSAAGEAVARAQAGAEQRVPLAAELDMAAARGGAVHTLRTKGRLCHRHVMVPEGPKYDSRGKLYLGEFERVKGRAYPQTAEPALLLPKCCNCCRKSVLGCE